MDNTTYFATIHSIKADIDTLDDAFWSNENPTQEETTRYNTKRQMMCDKLEEAYKA